jgi:hypothetical protein
MLQQRILPGDRDLILENPYTNNVPVSFLVADLSDRENYLRSGHAGIHFDNRIYI